MKNLMNDPDVMALYKALQNNRYEDIDDYLTSSPVDEVNVETSYAQERIQPERKMFWGGEEVSGYIESDDYGL